MSREEGWGRRFPGGDLRKSLAVLVFLGKICERHRKEGRTKRRMVRQSPQYDRWIVDAIAGVYAMSGGFGGTGNRSPMELHLVCSHSATASSPKPFSSGL